MANETQEMDNNEELDTGNVEIDARDYEAEARDMGWVEEGKFKGPKDNWVDAKTFLDRGEHILPIVKATRDKLRQESLTKDKEIATLKASVDAASKSIKALQQAHTEESQRKVDVAIKDIKEKMKLAYESGDIESFLELQDTLGDLKDSKKEVAEIVEAKHPATTDQTELSSDFKSWQSENKWFGDMENADNRKRTREIYRIGEDLRDEGNKLEGRPFFDKCLEILEERESGNTPTKKVASRVEGSDNGARRTSGRAFDSLPKEAREACHEDNDTFVGPGKKYKTVKEWEDDYAKLYNAQG